MTGQDLDVAALSEFGIESGDSSTEKPNEEAIVLDTRQEESSLNTEEVVEEVVTETKDEVVEETKEIQQEVKTEEVKAETEFGEFVDTNAPPTEGEVKEEVVTKDYISEFNEKYDTGYESMEDIFNATQKEDLTQAGSSLDRFLKSNPTSNLMDWFNIIAVDHEQLSPEQLIVQDHISKGRTQEDALFLYNQKFKQEKADEDLMDDSEISNINNSNRLKKIEEAEVADKLRSNRLTMKQEYSASMDSYKPTSEKQKADEISKEMSTAWKQETDESMKSLETMEVALGDGKAFKFSNKEFFESQKDSIGSLDKALDFIKKDDGSWDATKVNRLRALDHNFEKVSKALFNQGRGTGQKETIGRGKNTNYDTTKTKEAGASSDKNLEAIEGLRQQLGGNGLRMI